MQMSLLILAARAAPLQLNVKHTFLECTAVVVVVAVAADCCSVDLASALTVSIAQRLGARLV